MELDDASIRAAQNPYTFWKPSSELADRLTTGDQVRLIFTILQPEPEGPSAERMWVEIVERTTSGFVGELTNQPVCISDLATGARIAFEDKHIIDASIEDPVPDPTLRWAPLCLVTANILDGEARVGYFYRDDPVREEDSGWLFMSGDEDEAYMNDEANLHAVSIGAVLARDDRMIPLLDEAAPVAFAWDEDQQAFVAVEMPEPE